MFHYVYKTYSSTGLYYIGRHSTRNLNDGYKGSGKWVRSIKDKSKLTTIILKLCENLEEVKIEELRLIKENIDNKFNLNFSESSCGFSSGKLNPSNSPSERIRRSKFNWTKTKEGRIWLSENNPSKRDDVKVLRRIQANNQFKNNTHNFQNIKTRLIIETKFKNRLLSDNPSSTESGKKRLSEQAKKQFSGPLTCPYCDKIGSGPTMYRFHFSRCKNISLNPVNYK